MACTNPEVRGVCDLAKESFKKVCRRCKWNATAEEADKIRKTNKYNRRMSDRAAGA